MKIKFQIDSKIYIKNVKAKFSIMDILLIMGALDDLSKNPNRDDADRRDARQMLLYMRKKMDEAFKNA